MTIVVVGVLACAWGGYFLYCIADRRKSSTRHRDGVRNFSVSLKALGASAAPARRPALVQHANGAPAPRPGTGFGMPRSREEASRRRLQVMTVLVLLVLGSLVATPSFGAAAWAAHIVADVALVAFGVAAFQHRHRRAEHEIKQLILNPSYGLAPDPYGDPLAEPAAHAPPQPAPRQLAPAQAAPEFQPLAAAMPYAPVSDPYSHPGNGQAHGGDVSHAEPYAGARLPAVHHDAGLHQQAPHLAPAPEAHQPARADRSVSHLRIVPPDTPRRATG